MATAYADQAPIKPIQVGGSSYAVSEADRPTAEHSVHVAETFCGIAEKKGIQINQKELFLAGMLHDIGKSYMPEEVLTRKPGQFTDADMKTMKWHPLTGYEYLKTQGETLAADLAGRHHMFQGERSYPPTAPPKLSNLPEEKVNELARYLAIADSYEAFSRDNRRNGDVSKMTHEKKIELLKRDRPGNDELIDELHGAGIFK